MTRGPMLADFRDEANKPTAGIRLDIPGYLMGAFKTLEAFGYALRRRHGTSFRKHIKFDELLLSLYIQVGVKIENEDVDWSIYTPEEAREGMKKLTAKKGPRFDLLATPAKENAAGTSATTLQRTNNITAKKGKSGWIPPTKSKSTQDWRPPHEKEFEIDDDEME